VQGSSWEIMGTIIFLDYYLSVLCPSALDFGLEKQHYEPFRLALNSLSVPKGCGGFLLAITYLFIMNYLIVLIWCAIVFNVYNEGLRRNMRCTRYLHSASIKSSLISFFHGHDYLAMLEDSPFQLRVREVDLICVGSQGFG
jgi:hypothetical protein